MGPLIVLFFWLVGAACVYMLFVLFLAFRRYPKAEQPRPRSKTIAALCLPLFCGPAAVLGLVGLGIFNESVRRVDMGFGDYWQVPVANNFYLCMFDLTDRAQLMKDECAGIAKVRGVTTISEAKGIIVGTIEKSSAFSLDTSTGSVAYAKEVSELLSQHPDLAPLQSVEAFYSKRRFGWPDLVGLLLVGLLVLGSIRLWKGVCLRDRQLQ